MSDQRYLQDDFDKRLPHVRELLERATAGPYDATKPNVIRALRGDRAVPLFDVREPWGVCGARISDTLNQQHANCAALLSLLEAAPALLDAADHNAALLARVVELEGALRAIVAGDVQRPVAHHWREDRAPSKHDMCAHKVTMRDECANCTADFITATLERSVK